MTAEIIGAALLVIGLMGGLVRLAAHRPSSATLDRWREGTDRAGLTDIAIDDSVPGDFRLTARAGDCSVSLYVDWTGTIVRVGDLGVAAADLWLSCVRPGAGLFDTRGFDSGDRDFDAVVTVGGRTPVVRAVLTSDARAAVLALMRRTAAPVNGGLRLLHDRSLREVEFSGRELLVDVASRDPARVTRELPAILSVARHLKKPLDLAARLAQNATEDPVVGVRLANLEALIADFSGDPATTRTLRAATEDTEPSIRLSAAMALGPQGHATLQALARAEEVPRRIRVQALDSLIATAGIGHILTLLDYGLATGYLSSVRKAVVSLGRWRTAEAIPRLGVLLDHESNDIAVEAAIALGRIGNPAAEHSLLRTLGSVVSVRRRAAASALGRVGTTAAIVPLKDATAVFPRDRRLRLAARNAMDAIQRRASSSGAGAGHLSVFEPKAGDLAIAGDPDSGRISLGTGEETSGAKKGDQPPPRSLRG